MKRFLSFVLLLAIAAPVSAQSRIAKDVSVKPGELIVISANVKGEVAWLWDVREFDANHSRVHDPVEFEYSDGKDTKKALVPVNKLTLVTNKPGTYLVQLIAWDARKIENILVTVEGPPIPPPPPPPPPEPVPDSPLAKSLKAAIAGESAIDKPFIPTVAKACRKAAGAANDQSLTKVKQVDDVYIAAMKSTVGHALPYLRQAITTELNTLPRTVNAPLDAATRQRIFDVFTEIAAILEAVQ